MTAFTGRQYVASGLIYFNARYYDPIIGRFLTEDPSRKGHSWYSYCANNPLTYTDPAGRQSAAAAELTGNQPALDQRAAQANWRDYAGSTPVAEKLRAEILANATNSNIYGANPKLAGKVLPLNLPNYDCVSALSAVARKPLLGSWELADPKTRARHYVDISEAEYSAGDWVLVSYQLAGENAPRRHVQMNMGGGQYFESVPAPGGGGPRIVSESALDYFKREGIVYEEPVYFRPKQ